MGRIEKDLSSLDYEIRTLQVSNLLPSPTVECDAYGIEIVDGGNGGNNNYIELYNGQNASSTPTFSGDRIIRCIAGTRIPARFNRMRLVVQPNASDAVIVKLITSPRSAWVDVDPAGKTRTKFLTRTDGATTPLNLIAGATAVLFDTGSASFFPNQDHYWTVEKFEQQLYWYGHVAGTQSFTLHVFAKTNPNDVNSLYRAVQRFASKDLLTVPPPAALLSATVVAGHVIDFQSYAGPAINGSGSGGQVVFPTGVVRCAIECGGVAGAFEFSIGVRGSR